jgi:hypothetical protein
MGRIATNFDVHISTLRVLSLYNTQHQAQETLPFFEIHTFGTINLSIYPKYKSSLDAMDILMRVVEALYQYRNSKLFLMHVLAILIALASFVLFSVMKKKVVEEEIPEKPNFSTKIDYLDYDSYVKRNTKKELDNLEKSVDF